MDKTKRELLNPADIIDAVNSRDLGAKLLERNKAKAAAASHDLRKERWVSQANEELRGLYRGRAAHVYQELWRSCSHVIGQLYINGYNMKGCLACDYIDPSFYKREISADRYERAKRYNDYKIDMLRDRMIEVDEEVGILIWATIEDYEPRSKPKRWAKHRFQ